MIIAVLALVPIGLGKAMRAMKAKAATVVARGKAMKATSAVVKGTATKAMRAKVQGQSHGSHEGQCLD